MTWAARVRRELRRAADPAKAEPMRAYMKSAEPFLGVQAGPLRNAVRAAGDPGDWRAAVVELWDGARHREERYAALALLRRRSGELELADLPLLERLVVQGAWWDTVDPVSRCFGPLLRRHPREVGGLMRRWCRDGDRWKRRVAIVCQLGFKADTDLELLYGCIDPNLGEREFFVRKAIGWALRDYAWHDPDEVARYVAAHEGELSPLSRREATKNLGRLTRASAER